MKKNHIACYTVYAVFYTIFIAIARLMSISYMVGSYNVYFSGTNITVPLSGFFGGFWGCCSVGFLRFLVKLWFYGASPLLLLVHWLPGFIASLSFTVLKNNFLQVLFNLVMPVTCIVLFLIHPIGLQAAPYVLYWLIPVVIYVLNVRYIFFRALSSTFIAHAIGSVAWLYIMPMYGIALTALDWISLIPVVVLERLLFASGITIMHQVLLYAVQSGKQCWAVIFGVYQRYHAKDKDYVHE